jgi:RimJ/RimL family protein N-acetyltransferase
LRENTLDDAAFWGRAFSDPDVVELTAYASSRDLEATRAEITQFCNPSFGKGIGIRWGIVFKGHPCLVGTVRCCDWMREGGHRMQVGYDLLREYRHYGMMT